MMQSGVCVQMSRFTLEEGRNDLLYIPSNLGVVALEAGGC